MRRESLLLAAVLCVAAAAPLHAEPSTWFGIQSGAAMPQGQFKDVAKNGFAAEASLNHMFTRALGIGATAGFSDFHGTDAIDADATTYYGVPTKVVFTQSTYVAYAIAAAPMPGLTPYVRAGGGIYNPKIQVRTDMGLGSKTTNEWGYLAGGGFTFHATRQIDVGVDGTWHQYRDEGNDLDMSWVSAKLQLMFLLPGMSTALKP